MSKGKALKDRLLAWAAVHDAKLHEALKNNLAGFGALADAPWCAGELGPGFIARVVDAAAACGWPKEKWRIATRPDESD